MVFNFGFTNNATLPCFSFFLNNWLILFISAAIAQIFNPTADLVVLTKTSTNEANAAFEVNPLAAETETENVQNNLNFCSLF